MKPLELTIDDYRRLAERITDLTANHLANLESQRTFPITSGEQTERLFATPLPEQGMGEASLDALRDVVAHSRLQNGRFFGYVQGPGEPVAALGDFVASILTQNMTAWRSSPAGVTIERTVVRWLAEAVGCAGFTGTLTGGGSAANLMGLAMAREAKAPANEQGVQNAGRSIVYASEQVHMAVPKAVALLGLGRANLRYISCDSDFRMIPGQLDEAITRDKVQGKMPIAVVASAGTVNTGAIDPLTEIAAIAREHGAWFHIDGAYGALASLAAPEKFKGLSEADSLSLDPHKWLYQPLDCGCLLHRNLEIARQTFAYTGDYAKQLSTDPIEGFAFFEETMELSRRFRALKLWLSLRYHGLSAFRAAIKRDLDHAQHLATDIGNAVILELLAPVDLSAVCFRHTLRPDATEAARNEFNTNLLKLIVRRGRIYISNAVLHGKFCLRACVVNCRTSEADIAEVVPEVLAAAGELLSQPA
jgi:glutamate/tyrosine decarboxylase-like PLP-dependent enzyme